MAGNKCSSHGSSKKWRETNGRCHGNGWQHFEHIGSEMKQASTYRVPSASRICMLVTGCDSSKGVVGLLSACAA